MPMSLDSRQTARASYTTICYETAAPLGELGGQLGDWLCTASKCEGDILVHKFYCFAGDNIRTVEADE